MKKGFTLIELLVVVVIIGLLVTAALPKYRTAMEKGRGLEGVANAAAVSDAVNAYYVINNNQYGSASDMKSFALDNDGAAAVTKNKNFKAPTITVNADGSVAVKLERDLTTKAYTIEFVNQDGVISRRGCKGYTKYCQGLGAEGTDCSSTACPLE